MTLDGARTLRRLCAVGVLTAAALMTAQPDAGGQSQPRIRIGVIVPFSGPLGFSGEAARRELGSVLKGHELLFRDDEGQPARSLAQVDELIARDRVEIIIGPSIASATMAVIQRSRPAAIISLATLSTAQQSELRRHNEAVIAFDTVPDHQLKAVRDFIRAQGVRRLDAPFVGTDVALTDLLTGVQRDGVRLEPTRADVSKHDDVEIFARTAGRSRADLVLGTATESVAWDIVQRLGQNRSSAPVVIFATPRIETRARLAGKFALELIRQRRGSIAETFAEVTRRSPMVDRERRVISLGWSVVTARTSAGLERALDEGSSATTETRTCTCNSSDGTCNKVTCTKDQSCKKDESVTPCTVSCSN